MLALGAQPRQVPRVHRPPRPGDLKPTVQINVLWTLETQVNLDTALRHLRKPNEPLIIWVDAVCINQNDNAEKDQQVGQNLRQRIADVRVARAQRQRQRPRPGQTAEGWGGNAQREQWDIPETAVRRLDQRRSSGRVEPTIARRTPATCPRADPGILPQRYLLFRRVPHTSVKIVLDTDVDTTRGHPFAEARHLLRVPEVGLGCVRGWPRFRPPHKTSCNLRPPLQIRPRWHGRRYSSPVQFGFQITYNLPCSESYANAVRAIILSGDVDLLALSNRKKLENAFLGARLEDVYEDSERRFPLANAILRNEGPPRTRQHPQSQGMGRPSRARGMHCRSSRPHELSLASRCSWL